MNKQELKIRSRRSSKALVAKVAIPGAILWIRKYKTGNLSVWPQPEKGKYHREAKPILLKWAKKVGGQQNDLEDDLTWWVTPNQANLAIDTILQLEGIKIIELKLLKINPLTLAILPLSYWIEVLHKIRDWKPKLKNPQ